MAKLDGLIAAREMYGAWREATTPGSFWDWLNAAIAAERKSAEGREEASAVEEAYGILWRQVTDNKQIHQARKLLLSLIDVAGQRRGINSAVKQFGPVNPYEISGLADFTAIPPAKESAHGVIADIVRDVCELDYTSPDNQPNLLQVTTGELTAILENRLAALRAKPDALAEDMAKALEIFACECSGRCEEFEWLPAGNSSCAYYLARDLLARYRVAHPASPASTEVDRG